MHNRLRLLMGANALLYFGPLLAGLGGFGWNLVPVFTAIFVLWLLILRPQEWPRSPAEWRRPAALMTLGTRALMQLLLVLVCFGIGRGIGGVLGALPPLPVMLPLAISFLSIPLARIIWNPANSAPGLNDAQTAQAMIAPLGTLPDDTDEAELTSHLQAMAPHLSAQALFDALLARVSTPPTPNALRKALVIHATAPAAAQALQGSGALRQVFDVIAQDAELMVFFCRRCGALINDARATLTDLPPIARLHDAAATTPKAAAALTALAEVIDQARAKDA